MKVDIVLTPGKQLKQLLDMPEELHREVGRAVAVTAAEMEADMKLSIQQGPKTGRVYKRRTVLHQASSPGEPPASDTGVLMGSIYHEKDSDLTYTVGSRAVYAALLEYGTSRMGARPFLRPSVERMRPIFEGRIKTAIKGLAK